MASNINNSGIVDYNSLASHLTQSGSNVLIDFGGGNSLQLNAISLAQLSSDDFMFA